MTRHLSASYKKIRGFQQYASEHGFIRHKQQLKTVKYS